MSWAVRVAAPRCVASGMCLGVAPNLFTLTDGVSRPVVETVPDADADAALDAATCCPMEAITVVDAATGETVHGPADG